MNFCLQAVWRFGGVERNWIERATQFLSLSSPTRFLIFEGHANMPCSYCHATYTHISWQRLERQNDHSRLILVYNPANANDKLCIRPFCTVFKHCWKLTSALRYHALFLAGSSYQQTMSISLCSIELPIHMNGECFPNTRYCILVTQSLLSRSLKI